MYVSACKCMCVGGACVYACECVWPMSSTLFLGPTVCVGKAPGPQWSYELFRMSYLALVGHILNSGPTLLSLQVHPQPLLLKEWSRDPERSVCLAKAHSQL